MMNRGPCKFFVEFKLNFWGGYFGLEEHAHWNKFLRTNSITEEELALTRLEKGDGNYYFLLRRCPIGTGEEVWRSVVEEIHNKLDSEFGRIEIYFGDIG